MNANNAFFYKSILNSLRVSFARVSVIAISLFIGACVSSAFLNILLDIEYKLSNELKVYGANFIISPTHGQNHIDSRLYDEKIAQIPKDKLKAAAPFLYGSFSLGSNSAIVAGVDFGALKSVFPFIEVVDGHFGNSVFSESSAFVGVSLAKSAEIKAGDTITLTNQKTLESADLEVKGIISSGDEFDGIVFAPLKVVQNLASESENPPSLTEDASNCHIERSEISQNRDSSLNYRFAQNDKINAESTTNSQNLIAESHTAHNSQSNNRSNGGVALRCFDVERAKIGHKSPLSEVSYQNNANEYPRTNCPQDNAPKPFIHYAKLVLYGNFAEVKQIGESLSDSQIVAKPIAQVSISEGIVLNKIKSLIFLICATILFIASLSVNTSLSAIIFARKKEVALHLSLGAQKSQIAKLFGAEVLLLALISSVVGAICGYALANLLGWIIFNSSISFRFLSIVGAVGITLFFAFVASFYPIKKALNVNIITNLKGE
ncbi:ABC transporter permease [Helicobacter sp. 23-1044]